MADRTVAYRMYLDATGVATGAKVARNALQSISRDGITPVHKHLNALEKSARAHPEAWQHAGRAALMFGTGVAVSLGMATKAAASWQSDWAGVTKTVDGTTKQMHGLERGLRNLVATALPATHTEIAATAEAAGQLGVKTQNVLQFTKTIIDLGESTNLSAEQGGKQLARFMNIMGTSQSKIGNLGSAIVGLGNNFATTESEIMDMSMRIASAGRQAGMTEGDVLGLATALSSVGIEAEAGGTAASMVIKKIGLEVDRGGDRLDLFAKTAGMSTDKFSVAFKKNAAGALSSFVEGLGKAQAEGENVNATLGQLGIKGIRESNAILALASASEVMKNALATGNAEYIKASALAEEASKRYETAESRAKIAWNSIKDAGIDFGAALLPTFAKGADMVTGFMAKIRELPQPLKEATVGFAGIAGVTGLAAGGFLTLAPKVFDVIDGFKTLNATHPRLAGGMANLGKAAGIATVGLLAARGAAAALNSVIDTSSRSTSEMTSAIAELQNKASTDVKNTVLDPKLWEEANSFWNKGFGTGEIENWGDALDRVNKSGAGMQKWLDGVAGTRSDVTILSETIASTDEALRNLASGGSMESAADGFKAIRQQAKDMTDSEVLDQFPKYKDYLREVAGAAGLATDDSVLLAIATGKITEEMLEANASTGEGVDKLKNLGVEAKTTEEKISDLADEIRNFGKETLDSRSASREYEQALDDAAEALKKNGKTLDDTTQKGRDNADALDRVARSAAERAASVYQETQSEEELQKSLDGSRKELIRVARQFGMSKDEAEDYADKVLATPSDVKTKVKVDKEKAQTDLKKIVDKIKDADGTTAKMNVFVQFWESLKSWVSGKSPAKDPAREPGVPSRTHGTGRANDSAVKGPPKRKKPGSGYTGRTWGQYYGGVHVKAMAAGDLLDPIAQMVPPNTWRIVGDRLDVPEAFIPIDGSRRSWKILTETISRMPGSIPMAAGGVVAGGSDDERRRREEEAKRRREEAAARRERINDMRRDLHRDLRRGDIREQSTRGLSGAYSTVDRLYSLSRNEDLGRGTRARLSREAGGYERSLRRLYGQLEKVEKRAEKAQKKLDELKQIQDSVASAIGRSAYKLEFNTETVLGADGNWRQASGIAGARKNAAAAAAKVKDLAGKMNRLQKMGYSGVILQEVAQAGSLDESIQMADELLKGSSGDVRSLNRSYADIEKYANQAGKYVTHGFYKGGVDAAAGLVKGIESQQKQIEKSILNIAKSMESALKRALGIRSPAKATELIGQQTAEGLIVGIFDELDAVREAAEQLGAAAIPQMGAAAIPVTVGDAPEASTAMVDMSDQTLTAMQQMSEAVAQSMTDQQTQTITAQDAMRAATTTAQQEMGLATATSQSQQTQATTLEQTQMLATVRTTQTGMLDSTRTNYAAIRETGIRETQTLRTTNAATQAGMRADHYTHMGVLRDVNRAGFHEMRETGISAFRGLREGMHGQMQAAQPALGGDLNRLISIFGKFTTEVNKAFGDVGVKLTAPKALAYADGGVTPGWSPGRDIHHFHSKTAGDLYLSGGEAFMLPEFTRMVGGTDGVKAINRAAKRGDLRAVHSMMFSGGGTVPVLPPMAGVNAFADSGIWRPWWALVKKQFPQARLHSAYRPGAITATGNPSHHGAGRAIDITPSMAIFNWLASNYGPQTRELIFSPAGMRQLHRGRPHMYRGVTRAMHFSHIHLAAMRPPAGAGLVPPGEWDMYGDSSVMPPSHPFLDKVGVSAGANLEKAYREAAAKHITKIRKGISLDGLNPTMAQMARGVMDKAAVGLVDKAAKLGKDQTFTMPGGSGVERWRDTVIQALQRVGLPTTDDYVNAWLRQIKTESGGNPRAIQGNIGDINNKTGDLAHGLVQVIGSTFRAFRDKSLPNDRFHPLANLVAGMNWAKFKAKRRGKSMLSFIGHGHGYGEGTDSAVPGWKWVGEEGPELVRFKGGEQVIPSKVSHQIENQVLRGGHVAIEQSSIDDLKAALVTNVTEADMAKALDGVQLTLVVDGKQMAAHISTTVGRVAVDAGRSH